jgi:hypothetical protein
VVTIAWDVDDVLNDLMACWLEEGWKPAHPECTLRCEDITENPPAALLKVPISEYLASLDAFRSDRYARLEPRRDVLAWFRAHGNHFHHLALTAVPMQAASISAEWVLRHFGHWIRSFHFVPSPRPSDGHSTHDRTKEEFLRRHDHVTWLIDDSPKNVEGALRAGKKAILFPRPWNGHRMRAEEALQAILREARGT